VTEAPLHFVVPGSIEQRTGGYVYDARMVGEMRAAGWRVEVHELAGSFPDTDTMAATSMARALGSIPDDAPVVIDGLAGGGLPEVLAPHAHRLRLVGLVHHPLAEETGLPEASATRFAQSERAALAVCRGVVVTSPFTRSRLEAYGVPLRLVHVAVPGTEPAEPALGPGPGAPPRLLCVGSITQRKGHLVLLEALERVRALPWTCALAGSASLDPAHARLVSRRLQDLGLGERVDFLGELDRDALDEAYRTSSLFVLASHYEGYGMALTEAMARGLPILSTTGGAIPYTVPVEAGVLVPPGDADAFADALKSLLADGGDRIGTLRSGAVRVAGMLPDWREAARDFMVAVNAAAKGRLAVAEQPGLP
jgi:glycosyltransferase involved in cell wall biosynthesis